MQDIEPYHRWRDRYISEEDERSPFYGRDYSEFEYNNVIYNYVIHPQWDYFGSNTLFLKILYADYRKHYCIIELIGEWNDAIENDIATLWREIIEPMMEQKIAKFILIAENVLNFHSSDAEYYSEWFEAVSEANGWVVCLNMPESSQYDFRRKKLQYYVELMDLPDWRKYLPDMLYKLIDDKLKARLKNI